jgi:hypothetical protein
VATHGRGFWVIDDISALRQAGAAVAQADAHLFKPADTTLLDQGGDNGTPFQRDEPQAENPPEGVFIDYYLGDSTGGAVTLEVLDGDGNVLETFPAAPSRGGGPGGQEENIPRTSPLWQQPPEPFATSPGMHRAVWTPNTGRRRGFGGFGGRGAQRPVATLPGTFTARLTANGKSYEQTFMVRPDPRS